MEYEEIDEMISDLAQYLMIKFTDKFEPDNAVHWKDVIEQVLSQSRWYELNEAVEERL